jgi:hypothetical protein
MFKFKKDDYVIVVGATLNKDGTKTDYRFEISRVLEVAKYELAVEPLHGTFKRAYRAKKYNCHLVDLGAIRTHTHLNLPSIGDLVMHYHVGYDKIEKKVGILMHIIDAPGGEMIGKIIHDNNYVDVPYKDLMILEEKQL